VTYAYRLHDLLTLLGTRTPEKATELAASVRRVEHGLLSVGLKIHCLDDGAKFNNLIEGLGGSPRILEVNHFKDARASFCLVLPPVGSAAAAIHLIECIEQLRWVTHFRQPRHSTSALFPGTAQPTSIRPAGYRFYLGLHCVVTPKLTSKPHFSRTSIIRGEFGLFYTTHRATLIKPLSGGITLEY
jgi:hypothetical protein